MNSVIRARSPLRLGLAGGGSDVSPYCDIYGGYVLNATIDLYAYAFIRRLNEPKIRFVSSDLGVVDEITTSSWGGDSNADLRLHRAVYDEVMKSFNFGKPIHIELQTFCDAPIGSGLGSSSTLVVVMIKAFVELLNLSLDEYEIAALAFRIERVNCGLQGGRQDQYSAAFGGINFMEFNQSGRVIVNPLRIKDWILSELESSLVLFYTGKSRESAKIIEDQSRNISQGLHDALDSMHKIKNEAILMKEYLLKGDFEGIVNSMLEGWESKKKSAKTVTNAHINLIYDSAIESGALAGKVSGAGGGGFMMFFVPPEKRMNLVRALSGFQGVISNCRFTHNGAQAWTINQ
jgi:D-glycero-alpha-D-manno-heptose-7-phosphate kinase